MSTETDDRGHETTAGERRLHDGRGKFAPGNPGRPKGSRHVVLKMLDEIGDENAKAVWLKAIELAINGDTVAQKLVLDRVMPGRKMNPVKIDLPAKIETTADVVDAMMRVTTAVARGEISPDEGQAVKDVLEGARRAIETHTLARRLALIEQRMGGSQALALPYSEAEDER
ncbi:hypothetical protein J5Y09_04150 [Roseomonas sp. PWR1]|uniref:DUF5681 domain-containing protein n=1 Tax=Roseomonas nitratireducens TaxID=2820810 RepID=A0ABS4AQG0_9PROT|nr:DUF5681 domain-containing protein [Neoroseomonas nitratireducens]MBP0463093.1 hypothetical protein [Neoroseomonas nitratireducens]